MVWFFFVTKDVPHRRPLTILDSHNIGNRAFLCNLIRQPAFTQLKHHSPGAYRVVGT